MLRCLVEIKRPREGATTSRARRPRMRKLPGGVAQPIPEPGSGPASSPALSLAPQLRAQRGQLALYRRENGSHTRD